MKKNKLNVPHGTVKGSQEEKEQKQSKKRGKEEQVQDYLEILKQMYRK